MTGRRVVLTLIATVLALVPGEAYHLLGYRWIGVSTVTMQLQLGSPSRTLSDGSASWNAVAEGALAAWNENIGGLQFRVVRDSSAAIATPNGLNNVFWDDNYFGEDFGDAVAVAYTWSSEGRITESDVVFDNTENWNSFRGNPRSGVIDLRRIALHEFGHVLGLDHPDEIGQMAPVIMTSRISVDRLQPDDINGGQALYGAPAGPPPPPPPSDTLSSEQRLTAGQSRVSRNARFRLVYETSGNLVLHDDVARVSAWSTNTAGTSPGSAVLQSDGNFVVYDGQGAVRFASSSSGSNPRLVVQDDGNVVIYRGDGQPIWDRHRSGSTPAPPAPTNALSVDERLTAGQSRVSRNSRYRLQYETDGNLVLHDDVGRAAVWSTNTAGTSPGFAFMQPDGNFVLYDGQGAVRFATGSSGSQARLVVQDDGNLVIYRGDGQPIWDRHRSGPAPPPPSASVSETFTGSISAGDPVCAGSSTGSKSCRRHAFTVSGSGTAQARLTWSDRQNDLDLELWRGSTRLAASDGVTAEENVSATVSAGSYEWRVVYFGGSTGQSYTLAVTRPN